MPLYPTEVPITSKEEFIVQRELQGLALRDVAVSPLNKKGKPLVTHQMDMLFTHFGLSGPAILRCSQFVVKELRKSGGVPVQMRINSLPEHNEESCFQLLNRMMKEEPKKALKNLFKGLVPERWLLFLLERASIDGAMNSHEVPHDKIREFAKQLTSFTMLVHGTQSLDKAFVTGGGVSVKEVDPKTMGSKLMPGLYFCGEILDIHGYTGGYNITSALVTGRIAGMSAGKQ